MGPSPGRSMERRLRSRSATGLKSAGGSAPSAHRSSALGAGVGGESVLAGGSPSGTGPPLSASSPGFREVLSVVFRAGRVQPSGDTFTCR